MSQMSDQLAQKLHLGPWRIDLDNGTIDCDAAAEVLSPRAEKLLLLLCRHSHALVTRERILEEVWSGRVVEDTAIAQCVWQIRKALGPQSKHLLQTRSKRGYLLMVPAEAWQVPATPPTPEPLESTPPSDAQSPQTLPAPLPHAPDTRRFLSGSRRLLAVAVIAVASLCASLLWLAFAPSRAPLALGPHSELSIAVSLPKSLNWAASAVKREAAQAAYLRGADIAIFETAIARSPFSGPHLHVRSIRSTSTALIAEISLRDAEREARHRFEGSPDRLSSVVAELLERELTPAQDKPNPSGEAYVAGRVAELGHDNLGAVIHYRRALAQQPGLFEARAAIARVLSEQGRSRAALVWLQGIETGELDPQERCALDMLLVDIAPERIGASACAQVKARLRLNRLEFRESLALVDSVGVAGKKPTQWLLEEAIAILGMTRVQDMDAAEVRIERAQRIARGAGWEHAAVELDALRSTVFAQRGEVERAARLRLKTGQAMAALGDLDLAHYHLNYAYRLLPIAPGRDAAERRRALREIAQQARTLGNVSNETDALQNLIRLERDNPASWRQAVDRYEELLRLEYTPEAQAVERYVMLDEFLAVRRYDAVLSGLLAHRDIARANPFAKGWSLVLEANAHFARDDIPAAVAAVDALEKERFELGRRGEQCHFAWILAEAGRFDRAQGFVKQCLAANYDRAGRASRGDIGLLAQARLHQRTAAPERAWPTLAPRIADLLATPDLSRQEAASLTLLARHAVGMPSADTGMLQRALSVVQPLAVADGSEPSLRLGAHLLRWRLCRFEGRADCGPVLPQLAQQDRLEARLAEEMQVRQ
jgi:DNA-binding winged helix-turn-helix (wHTH) protein/tetratricopeptide (TPR) repeat protein